MQATSKPGGSLKPAAVFALLVAAALLRCWGLSRESFWFDEAGSVSFAQGTIRDVLQACARDSNPPLYFIGINLWQRVFQGSDAAIRAYGVVWSLIGLIALFLLTCDAVGWRAGCIALTLGAANPLDIYYAQEARPYSQAAALCIVSSWLLWRWLLTPSAPKRGRLLGTAFALAGGAALWTHFLAAAVLVAQGFFVVILWPLIKRNADSWSGCESGRGRPRFQVLQFFGAAVSIALLFLPWYVSVYRLRHGLYTPHIAWIRASATVEFISFLGREFQFGFSPLQDSWWKWCLVFPAIVAIIAFRSSRSKGTTYPDNGTDRLKRELQRDSRQFVLYAACLIIVPVLAMMLANRVYHPIYVRSRFAVFILGPFLALCGFVCASLRWRIAQLSLAGLLLAPMAIGTVNQYQTIQKTDWRAFAKAWQKEGPPEAVVFFPAYNELAASRYIGHHVKSSSWDSLWPRVADLKDRRIWICQETPYGFSLPGDHAFYSWLLSLGTPEPIRVDTNLIVTGVRIGIFNVPEIFKGRFDHWYRPADSLNRISGFEDTKYFYSIEKDPERGSFRWSKYSGGFRLHEADDISTVVVKFDLPPPIPKDYRPNLKFWVFRDVDIKTSAPLAPTAEVPAYRQGAIETELPVHAGAGDLKVSWTLDGINPARLGASGDDRDLGIRLWWVGVASRPR